MEATGADVVWVMVSAALVMFMTPGLAFFYGGMDRGRNVLNMLMMNFYCLLIIPLLWVVVGIPCAWIASRVPHRVLRRLAWLGLIVSIVLLALTQTGLGVEVNGNTNWLGVGPFQIQPAEIAKLAIVLWAAHVYALKDKRLTSFHEVVTPVVPGLLAVIALVVVGHDLGTALVLFAILLGLLWVVGVPARLFGLAISIVGVLAFYLAASNDERRARLTSFIDPFKDFQGAGWQAGHGLLGMSSEPAWIDMSLSPLYFQNSAEPQCLQKPRRPFSLDSYQVISPAPSTVRSSSAALVDA